MKFSNTMVKTQMPSELEMLARAGYHFREGFTKKIRYTQTDEELPFREPCLYNDGTYVLGPEKNEELLIVRDLFNSLNTTEISQTQIPGVLKIVTQHLPMSADFDYPAGKNNAGYLIHMSSETIPKDIDWKTFDLKTYNKLRYDHYR